MALVGASRAVVSLQCVEVETVGAARLGPAQECRAHAPALQGWGREELRQLGAVGAERSESGELRWQLRHGDVMPRNDLVEPASSPLRLGARMAQRRVDGVPGVGPEVDHDLEIARFVAADPHFAAP